MISRADPRSSVAQIIIERIAGERGLALKLANREATYRL
jgi:hypothetical protein